MTLVGPIAYFTRVSWKMLHFGKLLLQMAAMIPSTANSIIADWIKVSRPISGFPSSSLKMTPDNHLQI